MLVGVVLWLAMLAIAGPAELEGITAAELAAATTQLVLFGACLGALAFAVGAATGRKALALGISAGVAVLAYLASGFFPQVEGLEWTRQVSRWHWVPGRRAAQERPSGRRLAAPARGDPGTGGRRDSAVQPPRRRRLSSACLSTMPFPWLWVLTPW